jgi:hypothetical protein
MDGKDFRFTYSSPKPGVQSAFLEKYQLLHRVKLDYPID